MEADMPGKLSDFAENNPADLSHDKSKLLKLAWKSWRDKIRREQHSAEKIKELKSKLDSAVWPHVRFTATYNYTTSVLRATLLEWLVEDRAGRPPVESNYYPWVELVMENQGHDLDIANYPWTRGFAIRNHKYQPWMDNWVMWSDRWVDPLTSSLSAVKSNSERLLMREC
ncbi:hypothetical protein B0T17DRAFT_611533 [Bombardia bombarda]|uniref:Uncharacterized protein n=1 Tax=Bombardia bombarda TaxID=252184 RepID=A0AA39XII1_9PEZI|nr:hypothetical protein B0T17DRAFT_611533 [Bombardia bombarda]